MWSAKGVHSTGDKLCGGRHRTSASDNLLHLRQKAHGAAVVTCGARDAGIPGLGGKGHNTSIPSARYCIVTIYSCSDTFMKKVIA